MITKIIPFSDSSQFTFDSALVEFVGSVAQLKNIKPATCSFFASFQQSLNADYGDGVLAGTSMHGAAIASGKLGLAGGGNKYVTFDGVDNASAATQKGAVRFKYTPKYSGAPSVGTDSYAFFCITHAPVGKNDVQVTHINSNGYIYVGISDQDGVFLYHNPPASAGAWLPNANQTYEFEINYDLDNNIARLFIDGVQYGTGCALTSGGVRDASAIANIFVGTNNAQNYNADSDISDLAIFTEMQHTANYTPGPAPYKYSKANPSIRWNSSVYTSEIDSLLQTISASGSDQVKGVLIVDGVRKWWDGSAVATADGTYAQSNTLAELVAHKAAFLSGPAQLSFEWFLSSAYGGTTPSITSQTLTYVHAVPTPALPARCYVYVEVPHIMGLAGITSAKLRARPSAAFEHSGQIFPKEWAEAALDSAGYGELFLVETESLDAPVTYEFQIVCFINGVTSTLAYTPAVVPTLDEQNLAEISDPA